LDLPHPQGEYTSRKAMRYSKKGAKREVTADDVVYSIKRFIDVSTAFTLGPDQEVLRRSIATL